MWTRALAALPFAAWAGIGRTARAMAPAPPDLAATRSSIVAQGNRYRAEHGLRPLAPHRALAAAAQDYALVLAAQDRLAHDADGRRPEQRAQAQGYAWCMVAENVGLAFDSAGFDAATLARRLIDSWIGSPPHRHNLLATEALDTGVGVAHSVASDRYFAVQLFGRAPPPGRPGCGRGTR